ncbi:hypothetical protein P175DRAFT_0338220 [Aspergillus ochraceoroseus IBT 24754]|uniref:Uncharacterized protein n=1 Tax=Aspergillus ochraceoroseus IBT 24754 TaxID=1392256 RepID=A0A2T5LRK7_9EURO|nr:uncharacterized protein P175DRAFT_0338220 [Aspergillus ochraceoroseus IBT 24754]PTU18901.1 hypothetical protein P175DRAFT_0338220 [Aspergillus ochraceoroseus IBT 24754]
MRLGYQRLFPPAFERITRGYYLLSGLIQLTSDFMNRSCGSSQIETMGFLLVQLGRLECSKALSLWRSCALGTGWWNGANLSPLPSGAAFAGSPSRTRSSRPKKMRHYPAAFPSAGEKNFKPPITSEDPAARPSMKAISVQSEGVQVII